MKRSVRACFPARAVRLAIRLVDRRVHAPLARGLQFTLQHRAVELHIHDVGKDLAQAYLRAEYIEDVAKVYTFSKVLGTPVELASL